MHAERTRERGDEIEVNERGLTCYSLNSRGLSWVPAALTILLLDVITMTRRQVPRSIIKKKKNQQRRRRRKGKETERFGKSC